MTGNDQDNQLGGNSGDNTLDGLAGNDTAIYPRAESEYDVTYNADGTITVIGDGTDTLVNIESLVFAGQQATVTQPDSAESTTASINSSAVEESQAPTAIEGLEALLMEQLGYDELDALFDYLDSLDDEAFVELIQTTSRKS